MILKQFAFKTDAPKLIDLKDETAKNGVRHYLTPNGNRYPSLTTVLGHFEKEGIQKWRKRVGAEEANRVSAKATRRGTKIHKIMEDYVTGKLDVSKIMPDNLVHFRNCKPFVDNIDNIQQIECPLYSDVLRVAGRTDLIADYYETASIIDFKTSLKPKKIEWIHKYFEQGAGYSYMYEERTGIKIPQIVIIIAVDDMPEPQVFVTHRKLYRDSLWDKIQRYHREVLDNAA